MLTRKWCFGCISFHYLSQLHQQSVHNWFQLVVLYHLTFTNNTLIQMQKTTKFLESIILELYFLVYFQHDLLWCSIMLVLICHEWDIFTRYSYVHVSFLVFSITWKRQTTLAAFVSPVLGIITRIATWLGTAYRFYGEVTIFSTGQQLLFLYGGLVTLILPGIVSIIVSLTIKLYVLDWKKFKVAKIIVTEEEIDNSGITDGNSIDGEKKSNGEDVNSYLKSRISSQRSIQDETSKRDRKLDL